MLALHPNILTKNGSKEFAVLPYEEFLQIQEELQDLDDLRALREAKVAEESEPYISLEDAKKELGID